jgi:hypothetical protein
VEAVVEQTIKTLVAVVEVADTQIGHHLQLIQTLIQLLLVEAAGQTRAATQPRFLH